MSATNPLTSIVVPRPIPVLLSVVAGYVDSCTYLGLFGIFVAQLTGSLVVAGTELFKSEPAAPERLLAIPSFFIAGVAVSLLSHSMRERPRAALAWSLTIECMLLIGLFAACLTGMPFRGLDAPGAILALLFGMAAMGAQSALVHLMMRGVASTNVMTTNTTLLAISAARILVGWIERKRAILSETSNEDYVQARGEMAALFPLWLGFLAGTVLGAMAYITMGMSSVLLAALPVGGLAFWYAPIHKTIRPAEVRARAKVAPGKTNAATDPGSVEDHA